MIGQWNTIAFMRHLEESVLKLDKLKNLRGSGSIMDRIARLIVNSRYVIFVLFALACVYCALSIGRVKINSDLTAFLPNDTETRRGLTVMEDEFSTYATAQVMVSGLDLRHAEEMKDELSSLDHVLTVTFDDTEQHFKNGSALFSLSFDGAADDPAIEEALEAVKARVARYDHAVASDVGGDYNKQLAGEMTGVMLIAFAVIIAVLLFTSRSYFEVVIFAIVFAVAALLNMGTNCWLGEISSITNSIAVIMQLALAIDYAIIFAHRYQDEASAGPNEKEALIRALSKSIVEIASSSLTTISGLAALTLMQFRLGYDLGLVLSKSILCSMITVFLLMPGLIMLFPRAMKKTQHRSFIPNIERWGRFLMKRGVIFLVVFALILPFAIIFSRKAKFVFSGNSVSELVHSDSREAMHRIEESFEPNTPIAVLVPSGNYEYEKEILEAAEALPEIKSAVGLANVSAAEGVGLTDKITAGKVSDYLGIDPEQVHMLFRLYSVQNGEADVYKAAPDEYKVPLVDLMLCFFDVLDTGVVPLTEDQEAMVGPLRAELENGVRQLRGKNYDRLVLTASVPVEGESSTALVETLRGIAERRYGEGSVYLLGDITSARDLHDSYNSDSVLISLLTVLFVFIILLFTFRSPVTAAILVFVIQGSIFINFSFQYIMNMRSLFVTNMIVSAIQMGATIDYAIVLMSRYRALRKLYPKKEAMALAVNESFPTVLTSGAIMSVAGFVIAFRVSDVYIGHIGLAVGRGALISVIMVLSVLPPFIVLCDKLIEKTTVRRKKKDGTEKDEVPAA